MAILMVYKRNTQFVDLSELVENLVVWTNGYLKEYYDNPFKKEAKSIVADQVSSNS
ncbi:MAG TPA: hypothetical protein VNA18_01255 [Nitrososphaeraceae archaeon]|nr:hypothetical protein [Nitrososphaeraceae archaeon]